ncbi:CHASE3 domain-containing protein [Xanthobacter sp.]|uniref:sensor histidine kinase n=1 Tax=Xanthobacter sp. TaxID=35809 RepID=UPI0025FEE01B|nr:sensor histidine kinase [Xanthobacter sp.]
MTATLTQTAPRPWAHRLATPGPTLLLLLGFAILVAISASSITLIHRARSDAESVAHTLRVMNALSQLQVLIRRTESAERGYLITGREGFARFYEQSKAQTAPTLEQIATLITDNPQQQQRLAEARALIDERLASYEQSMALRTAGDLEGAVADLRADRTEGAMTRLGTLLVEMKAAETELLDERTDASHDSTVWLTVVSLTGLAVVLALGALALTLNRRQIGALQAAQRELEAANQGLEKRVAERTADLKEANDEIQSFAYIVSHDLRSPLVNIMGFTSEIEAMRGDLFERLSRLRAQAGDAPEADVELASDFDEALGFIKTSITRMDRLIHAILALSREGRKEFVPVDVDMGQLFANLRDSMTHQLHEAGGEIAIKRLPVIQSDRLALEQIFTNLLDNAFKYRRDDVPLRVEVSAVDTPGFVTFVIQDNGRGIDPKDRGRVFELFRRSGRQDRPGEGIGLAHVRALVRRMGGLISLDSKLGEGSTFKVTVPRRLPTETGKKDHG